MGARNNRARIPQPSPGEDGSLAVPVLDETITLAGPPGVYHLVANLASYRFGEGHFILNTFRVLENLDVNPAADRLLLNLISFAAGLVRAPLAQLPSDFDSHLRAIAYTR